MAGENGRIRILLADELALFREAVRVVLSGEDDLTVVAEAGDGINALNEAERTQPDVALLDADLPNCDGVRTAASIRTLLPDCRVLVLASAEDEARLIDSLEAGATGYLTKECPMSQLIDATRSVYRGEILIPQRMLGSLLMRLIHRRREQDSAMNKIGSLTRREREVLYHLADGAGNEQIAAALVISPETARTHIQNLLAKLEVHSRLEAAAFVAQNGLREDLVGSRR